METARRFDLRERISTGVSAEVYRAFDRQLDRDVVVRLLRDDLAPDDEYVERFQRAAEDAADVRHANVAVVLDHGVIDGRPFLVRELVEGSTLDDLLAQRGRLPEDQARALAAQIASGLAAAHARGVLHRDLSAGTVIVTPDGTAKVADFAMPGMPRHPAPEQVSGKQIDERVDVYGLGAVLYQMLTGHLPRGRPVSPRRLVPRVSKHIDAVAMRALEMDPARRYPTAAAMADALRSATPPVRSAPTTVRRVAPAALPVAIAAPRSAHPVVVPLARRRRSPILPFALLALPLVALVVAGLLFARTQPTRTAVLSATTTPQAVIATATVSPTQVATASPEPTSLPPVETTPQPTTEPTAAPTVAAPPPPPAAVAPTTQSAPVAPTTQGAPVATVLSFYDLVNRERFDEAAALWSPRMRASYPTATNIYGRFDRTRQIVVRGIAQSAESAGTATVTVDLLETLDSGVTRHWVGQWQLVWDGALWLMDAPNLTSA